MTTDAIKGTRIHTYEIVRITYQCSMQILKLSFFLCKKKFPNEYGICLRMDKFLGLLALLGWLL